MYRNKLYLCLLLAATGLWACGPEGKVNKVAEAASSPEAINPKDSLPYTIKKFVDFSPYFAGTESAMDTTSFSATYPVFNEEVNQLIKGALFVDGEDAVEQVSESFLSSFNEYAEDELHSGNKEFHAWFKDQQARVVLNTGRFLTVANALTDYTGGAHGMEVELWFNYDIANKKRLALTDLVQDTTRLKEIAEKHFRKKENLKETDSFGSGYFFDNNQFTLADNYGLTKEGLLFHYNIYEIKAYSEGSTTIIVPYKELKGLMTEVGNQLIDSLLPKK